MGPLMSIGVWAFGGGMTAIALLMILAPEASAERGSTLVVGAATVAGAIVGLVVYLTRERRR